MINIFILFRTQNSKSNAGGGRFVVIYAFQVFLEYLVMIFLKIIIIKISLRITYLIFFSKK